MKVRQILMTKGNHILQVQPHQTIREAARVLADNNIGAVIVVNAAGKLLGILSERDIVREAVYNTGLIFEERVSTIMTTDLIVASPEDELHNLAQAMHDRNIRHLPILDETDLIGVLSIKDVLAAIQAQYEGEIYHLREYVAADLDVTHKG